ncbi:TlyA family RNA methyltransferase [Clostridium taeniosporum]|uniref:TlyA family RNA methyltransferase n=1 Tax=Clostridium taeniosporum TaxID=394958 RepID=A0A1D7XKM5_9CLOT|nr:TlyA family RNA methyltransferase [Clostridium taeniosporum]AOR23903.1 TlyA family RNA methyltransferase [Clostridium taeniosporum]
MAEKKERLDILLVEKGIITSREKAKACIMEGKVFVDGQRVDKAGEKININANIEYKGPTLKYVSRGGLKLEKAMKSYNISLEDKVCMDIGASTGGFTDCMLQNGAKKVYSVDVGYGQFAWKLRTDERVVCMERTNIRYVTLEDIGEPLDFASIDVSFISLKKIMPATLGLLKDNGEVVALIKPQFEAGREKVGKKGVVREISTHKEVVYEIVEFLKNENLNILGVGYSPIKGPEGNREYLVYFTKDNEKESNFELEDIERVVEESHKEL